MIKSNYSSIETIIKIAKRGGMFILVDDEKREKFAREKFLMKKDDEDIYIIRRENE